MLNTIKHIAATVSFIYVSLVPNPLFGWTPPLTLSSGGSYDPSISGNSQGEAIVSWTAEDGDILTLQYSFYNGSSWTNPSSIISAGRNINSKIFLGDRGDSLVFWQSFNGSSHSLLASNYTRNGGWKSPVVLSDNYMDSFLSYACGPNDSIAIGWVTNENEIEIVRTSIGGSFTIAKPFSGFQGAKTDFKIRTINNDNLVAIWINRDSNAIVVSQTVNGFTSPWSDPVEIYPIINDYSLNCTVNSDGDILLTWIDLEAFCINALQRLNGTWENQATQLSIGTYFIRSVSTDKTFVLTWLNAENAMIQSTKSFNGKWESITDISNDLALAPFYVTSKEQSKTQVAWTDYNSSQVLYSELADDNTVLEPLALSTGDLSRNPKLANSANASIAVWENYTGIEQTIQVSVDAPGLLETVIDTTSGTVDAVLGIFGL